MRSGKLNKRIWIQARVEFKNAMGGVDWTYTDWAQDWAAIEPLTGRAYFQAQQVSSNVNTLIRMRYRPGMNEKMRVKHIVEFGSPQLIDYYEIEAIMPLEAGRWEQHLMCVKRTAEGFRAEGVE